MANVFGILTAIVLALSAFIAYKNKAAYEKEIADTATEKERLATSQKRLETARDNLASTIATRTKVDEEVVELTKQETERKKANDDLKAQIEQKTATSKTNQEKLDDIREKTAKVGDVRELAAKMRATNAELEELAQNITTHETKLANLTAENNQTEGQAGSIRTKLETMSSGRSLPNLETRIRSIYPTWGFVTLASGNSAGVVANSTLDVVRGGSTIAKLVVTAVERGTASASIIPDSVAPDTTLMVGDKVVPSQKAADKPAAPAPPPPAPAPAAPEPAAPEAAEPESAAPEAAPAFAEPEAVN